jgi:hypothetical protein
VCVFVCVYEGMDCVEWRALSYVVMKLQIMCKQDIFEELIAINFSCFQGCSGTMDLVC